MTSKSIKKAILVVSFGTSYDETRAKNIDALEEKIKAEYTDYAIYSAWTSKMILRKILKRDNKKINTVTEAMEQLVADGIEELIVQPTHIINGIENDIMTNDVMEFKDKFNKITFGAPLLNDTEDAISLVKILTNEYHDSLKDSALILVGHGSDHYINFAYAALDYSFKEQGHHNVFVGCIEAYPEMDNVLEQMKNFNFSKVIIIPFMLVAGDHATNDIASDDEDSWKTVFEKAGYDVTCYVKGLGEYEDVRNIYLNHLKTAISK